MSQHHVLAARCPKCQTVVQVKTRSEEKVVACPKCGTSMKVVAPRAPAPIAAGNAPSPVAARPAPPAAANDLPTARLWQDEPARGASPLILFLVASCIAGSLLGVGAAFAFRPSSEKGKEIARKAEEKTPSDVPANKETPEETPQESPSVVKKDEPAPQAIDPSLLTPPSAKSVTRPAARGGGDPQAKLSRTMARVQSLQRQRRDWLLANSGRQAARGLKVIVWPNERLLQQALQELEMARREAGQNR